MPPKAPGRPPPRTLINPQQDLADAIDDAHGEYQQFLAIPNVNNDPVAAHMNITPPMLVEDQMDKFRSQAGKFTKSAIQYEQKLHRVAAKESLALYLAPDTEVVEKLKTLFEEMLQKIPSLVDVLKAVGYESDNHSKENLQAAFDQVNRSLKELEDQQQIKEELATERTVVKQLQEDLAGAVGEVQQVRADCDNDKTKLNEEIEKLKGKVKEAEVARNAAATQGQQFTAPIRIKPS